MKKKPGRPVEYVKSTSQKNGSMFWFNGSVQRLLKRFKENGFMKRGTGSGNSKFKMA